MSTNPSSAGGADIGLVGLGMMGRNLALNLAGQGFAVAGCDSDAEMCAAFADALAADGGEGAAHSSLSDMVATLARPRRILLLVPAGAAVDEVITALLPMLDAGDVLVDGGNSHYPDTGRRAAHMEGSGVRFLGVGISGGAEGARLGASIMAGGDGPVSMPRRRSSNPPQQWSGMNPVSCGCNRRRPVIS